MPRRWDDDDDDYRPVYRGPRNYEGTGASIGDAIGDAVVSVTTGAANLAENIAREARRNDVLRNMGDAAADVGDMIKNTTAELGERVGQEWQKAASKISGEPPPPPQGGGNRRMLGNMPPGCFCDMRGYACPLHRGREAWRTSADFKHHVAHNVDPERAGSKATGIAGDGIVPEPTSRNSQPISTKNTVYCPVHFASCWQSHRVMIQVSPRIGLTSTSILGVRSLALARRHARARRVQV